MPSKETEAPKKQEGFMASQAPERLGKVQNVSVSGIWQLGGPDDHPKNSVQSKVVGNWGEAEKGIKKEVESCFV